MFQKMAVQINKILLFVIGLLLFLTGSTYSQLNYYWSGNKKIPLTVDSSKIIVLPVQKTENISGSRDLESGYVLIEPIEENATFQTATIYSLLCLETCGSPSSTDFQPLSVQ